MALALALSACAQPQARNGAGAPPGGTLAMSERDKDYLEMAALQLQNCAFQQAAANPPGASFTEIPVATGVFRSLGNSSATKIYVSDVLRLMLVFTDDVCGVSVPSVHMDGFDEKVPGIMLPLGGLLEGPLPIKSENGKLWLVSARNGFVYALSIRKTDDVFGAAGKGGKRAGTKLALQRATE